MIPSILLSNKKILVGITGSISAYKSIEFIRYLTKSGANVRVILSESAKRFITTLTIETLTGNQVLDKFTENWHSDYNHIAICKWADIFVIAPATANTINKLSNGIADNLLTQTALAYTKQKIIAPAANSAMLDNPFTQASLKLLRLANYTIINPTIKELACQTVGNGALAEPLDIFYSTCRILLKEQFWVNRKVIVTGGGIKENIDDMRYISNFSSGKMASALALALYIKGAEVCFISSAFPTMIPEEIYSINVQSSSEMYEQLTNLISIAKKGVMTKANITNKESIKLVQKEPYLFMAAAVADYKPKFKQQGKLKKKNLGQTWDITMHATTDILASIDKTDIKTIGFKAEMDEDFAFDNAMHMLKEKNIDAVCLNILKDSQSFGSDYNSITLISQKEPIIFKEKDKLSLSLDILSSVNNL